MVEIECKSKTVSQGYYYFSIAKAAKIHSQLLVNTDLSFAVIFIISFDLECHHCDYRKTFFWRGELMTPEVLVHGWLPHFCSLLGHNIILGTGEGTKPFTSWQMGSRERPGPERTFSVILQDLILQLVPTF